jgi:hypothetical protein
LDRVSVVALWQSKIENSKYKADPGGTLRLPFSFAILAQLLST